MLTWNTILWGIVFFGLFFFEPLLGAVGSICTTVIICLGLICIVVVKVVGYRTFPKELFEEEDSDAEMR